MMKIFSFPALLAVLANPLALSCIVRKSDQSEFREFRYKEPHETREQLIRMPIARRAAKLHDNQIRSSGQPWGILSSESLQDKQTPLLSFLPPLVQATVGLSFSSQTEDITLDALRDPDVDQCLPTTLVTTTNCWGTAWEFLRLTRTPHSTDPVDGEELPGMSVFYTSGEQILEKLQDPRHSRRIALIDEPKQHIWDDPVDGQNGVQPGDALLILQEPLVGGTSQLIHAAIALDQGLYYQKIGIENHALYQITTIEDIMNQYGAASGRAIKLEWRRFEGEPLPKAEELWAAQGSDQESNIAVGLSSGKRDQFSSQIKNIKLYFDAHIKRAQLDPAAFDSKTFVRDKKCGDNCMRCPFKLNGPQGSYDIEVPRISDSVDQIALVSRSKTTPPDFPQQGIVMSRTGPETFEEKWNCRKITVSFSSGTVSAQLKVDDGDKSPRVYCRRLGY